MWRHRKWGKWILATFTMHKDFTSDIRKWKYSLCCLRDAILKLKEIYQAAYKKLQFLEYNSVGPLCPLGSTNCGLLYLATSAAARMRGRAAGCCSTCRCSRGSRCSLWAGPGTETRTSVQKLLLNNKGWFPGTWTTSGPAVAKLYPKR